MTNMLIIVWVCSSIVTNCSVKNMATMVFQDYAACNEAREQMKVPLIPNLTHVGEKFEVRCLPQKMSDYQNDESSSQ